MSSGSWKKAGDRLKQQLSSRKISHGPKYSLACLIRHHGLVAAMTRRDKTYGVVSIFY